MLVQRPLDKDKSCTPTVASDSDSESKPRQKKTEPTKELKPALQQHLPTASHEPQPQKQSRSGNEALMSSGPGTCPFTTLPHARQNPNAELQEEAVRPGDCPALSPSNAQGSCRGAVQTATFARICQLIAAKINASEAKYAALQAISIADKNYAEADAMLKLMQEAWKKGSQR